MDYRALRDLADSLNNRFDEKQLENIILLLSYKDTTHKARAYIEQV